MNGKLGLFSLVLPALFLGSCRSGPTLTRDQVEQKTCPVMRGTPIDPAIHVDYKGRRIYLCCKPCVTAFKKNPEKYIKIVDREIREEREGGNPGK